MFLFYEERESKKLLQKHSESKHRTNFADVTKDALAEFALNEMTQI